jgi:hypothetical protein
MRTLFVFLALPLVRAMEKDLQRPDGPSKLDHPEPDLDPDIEH